jgi:hypothetical protein
MVRCRRPVGAITIRSSKPGSAAGDLNTTDTFSLTRTSPGRATPIEGSETDEAQTSVLGVCARCGLCQLLNEIRAGDV